VVQRKRFFNHSNHPASSRAGQRLSSTLRLNQLLEQAQLVVVSRMVKFDLSPHQFSMNDANSLTQIALKKWPDAKGIPSIPLAPAIMSSGFSCSPRGLVGKVTAEISFGRARPVFIRCTIRA